ncbi:MAG: ankyrin repeat domain-containing protein [Methyloprofundus sp.]|nr:ankyrin repeat domain-containing protein [Methyloprofundus sp.]
MNKDDLIHIMDSNNRQLTESKEVLHDLIHSVIKNKIDINTRDRWGKALIHLACHHDLGLVKYLVENGVNIDVEDKYQKTPIMLTAKLGNLITSAYLLKMGANLDTVNINDRNDALCEAARYGHKDVFKLILSKMIEQRSGKSDNSALLSVIQEGLLNLADDNYKKAEVFEEKKILHEIKSTLKKAVDNQNLERKAFPSELRNYLKRALYESSKAGHLNIVRVILDTGYRYSAGIKEVFQGCVRHPLVAAAKYEYIDIVEMLINSGVDVNPVMSPDISYRRSSPLHAACNNCNAELIRILINAGADVNKVSPPPYHEYYPDALIANYMSDSQKWPYFKKYTQCLTLLANAGLDFSKRDNKVFGGTFLMLARQFLESEVYEDEFSLLEDVIKLLFKNGAGTDGLNPYGKFDVFEYIEDKKSNRDEDGDVFNKKKRFLMACLRNHKA